MKAIWKVDADVIPSTIFLKNTMAYRCVTDSHDSYTFSARVWHVQLQGCLSVDDASIVLQVTFSRSDCNELWGLASIFPMVPKDRINNRVRVNEWTKAHVVQRLVSVLMNLESTQSWLKLSWRLNPLKKWPGHPISP